MLVAHLASKASFLRDSGDLYIITTFCVAMVALMLQIGGAECNPELNGKLDTVLVIETRSRNEN
jgi:hypothetical protein